MTIDVLQTSKDHSSCNVRKKKIITFILGNAYQSLIISFMTASRNGTMYNSFNDIFNYNEFNFIVDSMFLSYFKTSDEYLKLSHRMEESHQNLDQVWKFDFEELANNNTVLIMLCNIAEHLLYAKNDRKQFQANALKFYYLLPDRMHSFFEKLVLSLNSPFYDEFQRFSTLLFESGVRQYWNAMKFFDDVRADDEVKRIEDEQYLLNMEDLYGVFVIWVLGIVTAGFVLMIEVSWFECLRHLRIKFIRNKNCCQKKRVPEMKVRKIHWICYD